jgi:hypothetical protein
MNTALLDDIGEELDVLAELRHASRDIERSSLDWPELRRAVLAYGGIGPSRDWPRDWVPGDLFRAAGPAPDLVAAEAVHSAPWGDTGDDSAMMSYLRAAFAQWQRFNADAPHRAPKRSEVPAPVKRARGTRSYVELVRELKLKHGDAVPLEGLRSEYVHAYETGERVTVERDGREYRGTIGATRGPRPRFVLLLSLDL